MTWRPLPEPPEDRAPRSIRESLDGVTHGLGGPGGEVLARLFGRWEELVGEAVAAHAQPVSLVGGRLVVAVDEAAWATQLRWLEADLLRRFDVALGGGCVRQLQVRVRPR
jgi:hypothetical protein